MNLLDMLNKITMWEESLASAVIENNSLAKYHLEVLDDIDDLEEKYIYLNNMLDELEMLKIKQKNL